MVQVRRTASFLPAVALLLALVGSSLTVSVGHAARPVASLPSINVAMVSDINTLDPCKSSSFYDRQILNNVMDKLFDLNSKGKVVPMLATGAKITNGGLTYTITLRK